MDKVTENWDLIIESVREEYAVRDVPFRTFLQPLKIGSVEGQHRSRATYNYVRVVRNESARNP